jgi:A/G-specific adenine glycosylase
MKAEKIYPMTRPRKKLPVKTTIFIMVKNERDEILLEKRPEQGIWGGLFSFPECATLSEVSLWCEKKLCITASDYRIWDTVRHTFTHFHLDIIPVEILEILKNHQNLAFSDVFWYNGRQKYGLAAPVARLLKILIGTQKGELLL